jgi:hypothetical protein
VGENETSRRDAQATIATTTTSRGANTATSSRSAPTATAIVGSLLSR